MSVFMPLQKILCWKQPDGKYKVTFIKAYSEEVPMELIADDTTEYDVTYRNTSGASASLSSQAFNSIECSDGSNPDQYCQCIDEGFYHSLPDSVRPDEVDTPVKLLLVYGDSTDTVTVDDSGIVTADVSVSVDDADFAEAIGNKSGSWLFTAVTVDEDVVWKLNDKVVDPTDYAITITGDAEEGDAFIVTNVHEIGDNIAATDVLTVAVAE